MLLNNVNPKHVHPTFEKAGSVAELDRVRAQGDRLESLLCPDVVEVEGLCRVQESQAPRVQPPHVEQAERKVDCLQGG